MKYELIRNFTNDKGLEFNIIKLYNISNKWELFICNVYIAPDAKTDQIDILFDSLIENIDKTLIVGDLNAHHKKWSKGKIGSSGMGYTEQQEMNNRFQPRLTKQGSWTQRDGVYRAM